MIFISFYHGPFTVCSMVVTFGDVIWYKSGERLATREGYLLSSNYFRFFLPSRQINASHSLSCSPPADLISFPRRQLLTSTLYHAPPLPPRCHWVTWTILLNLHKVKASLSEVQATLDLLLSPRFSLLSVSGILNWGSHQIQWSSWRDFYV